MNVQTTSSCRRVVISAGGACVLIGILPLAGWICHIAALTRIGPFSQPMVTNSAVGFVLDGLALVFLASGRRRYALPGVAWSLIAGLLTLLEYGLSVDLRFDQMLVADWITQVGHPGRIAPNTALYFLLCGAALWCATRSPMSVRTSNVLGILGAVVASGRNFVGFGLSGRLSHISMGPLCADGCEHRRRVHGVSVSAW